MNPIFLDVYEAIHFYIERIFLFNYYVGMNEVNSYSTLMSVYAKEKPAFFKESVMSILNQTVKTNDFVIICDGPLTSELDSLIEFFVNSNKNIFQIVRKEKNEGLGLALRQGILECKNEIIMRMDSDDISDPHRAEIELQKMDEYDIVGSDIVEFEGDISKLIGKRIVPKTFIEIKKYAKQRSPFNHPSVMFKKSVVLKAGNYQDFMFREDYFLWIRMIQITQKMCNLPDILVFMRSGTQMRLRRADKRGRLASKRILKYQLSEKNISVCEFIIISIKQWVFYSSPLWLKKIYYKKLLRAEH